jgi:tellurite resistance protein TerB
MSFFDTLKQKAGEARAKLATEVGKFKNRDFMEACVAGCALVAAADGSIDASEKQKMMKFIQQSNELKVFDTKDVIAVFNKVNENFEFDNEIGKAEALKVIGKLRSKPDAARLMAIKGIWYRRTTCPGTTSVGATMCTVIGSPRNSFTVDIC